MKYPKNNFPGGVWPVMLTPMTEDKEIDEKGLRALVNWYIENGVHGLFAACQSREIWKLNFEERVQIARITVEEAAGRVPVVASGHTQCEGCNRNQKFFHSFCSYFCFCIVKNR